MTLALCIPTHHGRADTLRTLLDSIVAQGGVPTGSVEICISDNASEDGTAALVAAYQSASPFPIRYHRFPVNRGGVENFVQVVDMASADWCWLVGSDDALTPGALARALAAIDAHPEAVGLAGRKLNYDRTLTWLHSRDHWVGLPTSPNRPRVIAPSQCVRQLGLAWGYMSVHLFRRDAWLAAVRDMGMDALRALRHFPHPYLFATMARERGWVWLAGEPLVLQRLDNFAVMDAVGGDGARYATELTHDLFAAYSAATGTDATTNLSLATRLFVVYWNPLAVLRYDLTDAARLEAWRRCAHWFRRVPLFWLTTAPLLRLTSARVPDWLLNAAAPYPPNSKGWPR